jgi:hypothetical protein
MFAQGILESHLELTSNERCEFESRSGEAYSIQHYVIKFVSDLRQIGGFLILLWFPSPFDTLLFYTLIFSSTTLRYMFAQGILESHLELTSNAWVADIRTNEHVFSGLVTM